MCSSHNEGYYFIYSYHLLEGDFFAALSRPLFILIYGIVVKLFGFGAWSILVIHFLQTVMAVLIGCLIYLILKELISSSLYAWFGCLLWILFLLAPTGDWRGDFEINALFALEAEYFSSFLSLLSIYLMILNINERATNFMVLLFSCVCPVLSFMFKGSGAVLIIAYIFWFLYLLIFYKEFILKRKKHLIFFFLGVLGLSVLFIVIASVWYGNIAQFLKGYFLTGSYSREHLSSFVYFLASLIKFVFRYKVSLEQVGNLVLSLFALLGFLWCFFRNSFLGLKEKTNSLLWVLIAIWMVGNAFAVMAPGAYGSYYYILVWPGMCIISVLFMRDLFELFKGKIYGRFFCGLVVIIYCCIFSHKLFMLLPFYASAIKTNYHLSFFNQPQSLQDPVLPYDLKKSRRPPVFQVADFLNSFLPDKDDTIYIFNFPKKHFTFSPNMYVYIKRMPPTKILSDFFSRGEYLEERIKILKADLLNAPPNVILIPKTVPIKKRHIEVLTPFIRWVDLYLASKYNLALTFDYTFPGLGEKQSYEIYIRRDSVSGLGKKIEN